MGKAKAPRSLRSNATFGLVNDTPDNHSGAKVSARGLRGHRAAVRVPATTAGNSVRRSITIQPELSY